MKLEEVIERLEKLLKLRLNKANEIKYDNCIIATEDLQIILKYIKEESISKTVVEEKIKQLKEQSGGNVFHIQQTLNSNIRLLQGLLNKGE